MGPGSQVLGPSFRVPGLRPPLLRWVPGLWPQFQPEVPGLGPTFRICQAKSLKDFTKGKYLEPNFSIVQPATWRKGLHHRIFSVSFMRNKGQCTNGPTSTTVQSSKQLNFWKSQFWAQNLTFWPRPPGVKNFFSKIGKRHLFTFMLF